ncbi:transposase [Haloferula luteola]|uniref:Transposase n=1 Tax=Haloferula luteola TaxID=595692 RepID=A0A840UVY4_9BACT|nr:hypothetical protein [Haloferula luteola]MBB5349885.1 transposase [Haloferula luteola]
MKDVGKRRYVVENFFGSIKCFRRIGTRYDRIAEIDAFLRIPRCLNGLAA